MVDRAKLSLGIKCKGSEAPGFFNKKNFIGTDFYVVPVSMIVAGAYYPDVSNKESGTAIYFDAAEIKNSLGTWDGKPAALNHPPSGQSLNSPHVFNNHWLGFVFGSYYEEKTQRLAAELWLQEGRSKGIMDQLMAGDEIDVSIGAFGDIIEEKGESNGVQYEYKVTNMTGDHLAVLPASKGACGWGDGCGIRAEDSKESLTSLIRSTARTPSYDGVETSSWENVSKSLGNFYRGYLKAKGKTSEGAPSIENLDSAAKNWIASKSLLGDPGASDFRDLLFFPVVNPSTNKLNLGALRAVLGGRGSQANISSTARESAQNKAKSLLDKHSNTGVSAMTEPCMEENIAVEKITAKDIMENKDKYCSRVVEALVAASKEREDLIEELSKTSINGVSLDSAFLSEAATKDLKDLKKIIDHKIEVPSIEAKEEKKEEKVVDFSLGAGTASKEELAYLPPKTIDWS